MVFVRNNEKAEIFDRFMRNEVLAKELYVFLKKISFNYKNNDDEREDMVQRTLLKIFEKIETFDLDQNQDQNLIKLKKISSITMKRTAIDDYKSADNRLVNRGLDITESKIEKNISNIGARMQSSIEQDPTVSVGRELAADRLIEFFHKYLSKEQAEVLILSARDEKNTDEIAEILGIEKATVYTRKNRAINKLNPHREELAELISELEI